MLIMRWMSHWPPGIPADNFFQRAEMLLQLFLQLKRPSTHTEDGIGQCDTTHVAISILGATFTKHTLGRLWKHLSADAQDQLILPCVHLSSLCVLLDASESVFKQDKSGFCHPERSNHRVVTTKFSTRGVALGDKSALLLVQMHEHAQLKVHYVRIREQLITSAANCC